MEKLLRVAEMRDLEKQVTKGEISYSRMVEIINEKHFLKLVELRQSLAIQKIDRALEQGDEAIKILSKGEGVVTDEMINNEADSLYKYDTRYGDAYSFTFKRGAKWMRDKLQLPDTAKEAWISVADKLPEDETDCLAYYQGGQIGQTFFWNKEEGFDPYQEPLFVEVLYWMPLPKAPNNS